MPAGEYMEFHICHKPEQQVVTLIPMGGWKINEQEYCKCGGSL